MDFVKTWPVWIEGMVINITIATIILFTVWVKRNEWFGKKIQKQTTKKNGEENPPPTSILTRVKEGIPNLSSFKKPKWVDKIKIDWWVIIGYTFILFFPLVFEGLRDWWWNEVLTKKVSLSIILGLVIFGSMMRDDPKNPHRYKLAKWAQVVMVVLALWQISKHPYFKDLSLSLPSFTFFKVSQTPQTSENRIDGIKRWESLPEGKDREVVEKFFREETYLSEHLSEVAIAVCGLESGFRQFDEDGTPLRGIENSDDTGVCQINKFTWQEKAEELGLDIETLDGNLMMALWIIENDPNGIRSWVKYPEAEFYVLRRGVTIEAPVDNESEMVNLYSSCFGRPNKKIMAITDSGNVVIEPNNIPTGVPTKTIRYRSLAGEPGKVQLKCD